MGSVLTSRILKSKELRFEVALPILKIHHQSSCTNADLILAKQYLALQFVRCVRDRA